MSHRTRTELQATRITRRGLLGTGAAGTVFAAAGFPAGALPARGGALRLAVPPGWMFDRILAPGSVYDCLTVIGADGVLSGELAASWHARNGGREWLIGLRADASFHDGTPVTADRVARTLRGLPVPGLRQVRETAGNALRFTLAQPDPEFPLRLADPALAIRPDGPGSGLYALAELDPGKRARLFRMANHPRDGRAGWFDRVEVLAVTDADTRLDMLLSGRVDAAFALAPSARAILFRARRHGHVSQVATGPDGPGRLLIGHTLRLKGADGRDPFRLPERGHFA